MFTSRLFGGAAVTSRPSSRTVPWVGSSNPAIIRIVVVLPHPDGPSMEKNSPLRMARSMPRTAATTSPREWNSLTTPSSPMAGILGSAAGSVAVAGAGPAADASVSVMSRASPSSPARSSISNHFV